MSNENEKKIIDKIQAIFSRANNNANEYDAQIKVAVAHAHCSDIITSIQAIQAKYHRESSEQTSYEHCFQPPLLILRSELITLIIRVTF